MPPRIGNNPTFASVRVQQPSGGQTEDDMEYKAWVRVGTFPRYSGPGSRRDRSAGVLKDWRLRCCYSGDGNVSKLYHWNTITELPVRATRQVLSNIFGADMRSLSRALCHTKLCYTGLLVDNIQGVCGYPLPYHMRFAILLLVSCSPSLLSNSSQTVRQYSKLINELGDEECHYL
jgi:hypothetical protein